MMNPSATDEDFLWDSFPDGFQWGAATSAYQVEGAWNIDGKGESMWDRFCHTPGKIENGDSGDIACDSYHKYPEDIAILKKLGVHFYRFSLSWPRILPRGTLELVNEAGIDYYNRLIDGLLAEGIQPMVTLFHWDLPQTLEDEGGWLNPKTIDHFRSFARLCFERFGDRVKTWLTINEPYVFAVLGYGSAHFAPGILLPLTAPYQVGHNLIKSHAEAWHVYDKEFRHLQNGRISLGMVNHWFEPYSDKEQDIAAADRAMEFMLGWFAHPIFVDGDYPQVMKDRVRVKSQAEGLNESRLPEFTDDEKKRIKGTQDFFALNHYTTFLVENHEYSTTENEKQSLLYDQDTKTHSDPLWPKSGRDIFRDVPWGLRKSLVWIKERYSNPEVLITENGISDDSEHRGSLDDQQRIRYIRGYTNNVLKAIKMDGCRVSAYTVWSLMDNFEWSDGFSSTFGLHRVDFSHPNLPRIPKASAEFYRKLVENNGFSKEPSSKSTKL